MVPAFNRNNKVSSLPSLNSNNEEDERKSHEHVDKQTSSNLHLPSSQHQDHEPNDIQVPTITESISVDPYSLSFTIKSSFTLLLKDEYCSYYVKGFNLLHDSRTSK